MSETGYREGESQESVSLIPVFNVNIPRFSLFLPPVALSDTVTKNS